MTKDSDILIAGGGLNGPALALALAQSGFDVTVVDARAAPERTNENFDGRGYALALAGQRLLHAIGVWTHLAPKAQPLLEIKVSDGHVNQGPSPFFLHFDHEEIEEGPMGYMIQDRHVYQAFLNAMKANDRITLLSETSVINQMVEPAGVTVNLSKGPTHRTRLLVGCDGRGSGVANRAGIRRTGWGYGQTALVCAVAHEKPHDGIAHQFFMPPGPLAILPLPGNMSSIVWSETEKNATHIHALSDADYMQVLRPRFGDFLGAIELVGNRFMYPLSLSVANKFIADRVALVGDAAHGMHPIAGQGLNAGLRDVAALAQVLKEAQSRGEDIASTLVLERYQRWRRFDTAALVAATDLTNKLFSNDNPLLRAGRDIGMGLINSVPGLRRSFIREAAGLTGDMPDLMR